MSLKSVFRLSKSSYLQNLSVFSIRKYSTLEPTIQKEVPSNEAANPDAPIQMANPFEKEKVKCILCKHGIVPDYKNVKLLSQFQSPYTGRIYGRHITGLCKKMQEKVEKEIIKSQGCGFMGYYHKSLDFLKDPKLFDPERPIRPHKY